MKGTGRLITATAGRAKAVGMVAAGAAAIGADIAARTAMLGPINGQAERTRATGLLHYLRVLPEQPQELVWLTPMVGIDYYIETSNNLEWEIK